MNKDFLKLCSSPGGTFKVTLAACALLAGLIFAWQVPSRADLNDELLDDYLARQFDWAIHINIDDIDHYLNYRGATMHPLTKVSLDYTRFEHTNKGDILSSGRKSHEERWYHDGLDIGLRRRSQLSFPEGQVGTIIVENMGDRAEQSLALANTLVGLLIDVQLKRGDVSVVMVPRENYDEVSRGLAHYNFYPNSDVIEGKQMSINLRGYPLGKEEYFFLRQ